MLNYNYTFYTFYNYKYTFFTFVLFTNKLYLNLKLSYNFIKKHLTYLKKNILDVEITLILTWKIPQLV